MDYFFLWWSCPVLIHGGKWPPQRWSQLTWDLRKSSSCFPGSIFLKNHTWCLVKKTVRCVKVPVWCLCFFLRRVDRFHVLMLLRIKKTQDEEKVPKSCVVTSNRLRWRFLKEKKMIQSSHKLSRSSFVEELFITRDLMWVSFFEMGRQMWPHKPAKTTKQKKLYLYLVKEAMTEILIRSLTW